MLADNQIDMRAFSLAEASDFGIARIIVDDVYETATVLKDAGYICSMSTVLAVSMSDAPGGLNKVLQVLAEHRINIEYMYAFLGGADTGKAYMIFKVADAEKAQALLAANGNRLVDQEELSEL